MVGDEDNQGYEARSLAGLDFICGNLDFILGGVSSYGKTVQQGHALLPPQLGSGGLDDTHECRGG